MYIIFIIKNFLKHDVVAFQHLETVQIILFYSLDLYSYHA